MYAKSKRHNDLNYYVSKIPFRNRFHGKLTKYNQQLDGIDRTIIDRTYVVNQE